MKRSNGRKAVSAAATFLTAAQIEARLSALEEMMARASAKDLPGLTVTYQKLLDKLVEMDLRAADCR